MEIKHVLSEQGFSFQKKYGQNFLTDDNLLNEIVESADVNENSTVIEIGVGAGTLTACIAKKVKKVYGFEIDLNLKPVLNKTLADAFNVELIFKDVMSISIQEIESLVKGRYTVIANLPYYITTPIIMRFIEEAKNVDAIVITVQKEVADRICAKAGTSDYGAITASINAVANSKMIKFIDRRMFYPSPNVDSAVVKITIDRNKFSIKDILTYRKTVRTAFLMRRKTLVNNLIKGFDFSRSECEEVLSSVDILPNARGETLEAKDFVRLSNAIFERSK